MRTLHHSARDVHHVCGEEGVGQLQHLRGVCANCGGRGLHGAEQLGVLVNSARSAEVGSVGRHQTALLVLNQQVDVPLHS